MANQTLSRQSGQGAYSVLDPIVDLLLSHGNKVVSSPRWCSNPTGYYCLLEQPIDFELIEREFEVPNSITLLKELGHIDYGFGTAVISQK